MACGFRRLASVLATRAKNAHLRGTPAADKLDILATLAERYEHRRWPIPEGDPVDIIRFMMEQREEGQSGLARLLGSASRASEILNRRRALTIEMVWKLNREWRIPAELLVRPHELAARPGGGGTEPRYSGGEEPMGAGAFPDRCSRVSDRNAPTQDPAAAKTTYTQFSV